MAVHSYWFPMVYELPGSVPFICQQRHFKQCYSKFHQRYDDSLLVKREDFLS